MILSLLRVVYDKRARDGTWCKLPYGKVGTRKDGSPIYSHPNGCPNFGDPSKCPKKYPDFNTLPPMRWYAVIHSFDLQAREEEYMKKPWVKSKRQARCVLYWQSGHMAELMAMAEEFREAELKSGSIILEVPEACGVHVYETMKLHGFALKPITEDLDVAHKIVLAGEPLS